MTAATHINAAHRFRLGTLNKGIQCATTTIRLFIDRKDAINTLAEACSALISFCCDRGTRYRTS